MPPAALPARPSTVTPEFPGNTCPRGMTGRGQRTGVCVHKRCASRDQIAALCVLRELSKSLLLPRPPSHVCKTQLERENVEPSAWPKLRIDNKGRGLLKELNNLGKKSLEDIAQCLSYNGREYLLAIVLSVIPFLTFWPYLKAFSSPRNLSDTDSHTYATQVPPRSSTPVPSRAVATIHVWPFRFK